VCVRAHTQIQDEEEGTAGERERGATPQIIRQEVLICIYTHVYV